MEEVSFKKFLQDNGICPKLFWKACKMKNQGWSYPEHYYSRKTLKFSHPTKWIVNAFNFASNIVSNNSDMWWELSAKWSDEIIDKSPIFDINPREEFPYVSFKKFLIDNGIELKLFWKACKRKHQDWYLVGRYRGRKDIKLRDEKFWIKLAFNWESNLIDNDYAKWKEIDTKWTKAIKGKIPIFDIDQ